MFGFDGGETAEAVARKRSYMRSAQEQWPFLTNLDLSEIKNEAQLIQMVHIRASVSAEQATNEVRAWARDKTF